MPSIYMLIPVSFYVHVVNEQYHSTCIWPDSQVIPVLGHSVLVSYQTFLYQQQSHFNKLDNTSLQTQCLSRKTSHSCNYQEKEELKHLGFTRASDEVVAASAHENALVSVNLGTTLAVIHVLSSIYTWILVQNKNKKKKGNASSNKMQLNCCSLPKNGEGAKHLLHKGSPWKTRSTDKN